MKHGADWYKRDPQAYLGGVVGLSAREHAVYSVVLDLIYAHGGSCPNDAKWISGWFSDLGPAAVRSAVENLLSKGKLRLTNEGEISNKRAENEAKTKEILRKTRQDAGKLGGKKSGTARKSDAADNENNELEESHASSKPEPNGFPREEKRREEKSFASSLRSEGARANRAYRLPKDWSLPDDWLAWAVDAGCSEQEAKGQADRFRDYWLAKPGKDGTKVDWSATWRNWIRKHLDGRGAVNGHAAPNGRAERWSHLDAMKLEGACPLDPGETLEMVRAKRDRFFPHRRGGTA